MGVEEFSIAAIELFGLFQQMNRALYAYFSGAVFSFFVGADALSLFLFFSIAVF